MFVRGYPVVITVFSPNHVYPLVVAAQHPAPLGALIKSCTESITESIVESVTEYFLLGARHVLRCHHGAS